MLTTEKKSAAPADFSDRMAEARTRANHLRYFGPTQPQMRAAYTMFGMLVGLVLSLLLTMIGEAPTRAACTVLQADDVAKW